MQNNTQKLTTLLGGKTIPVQFEDGTVGELKVRQFRLKDYELAFSLLADEIGLLALNAGQARQYIETLSPESFEAAFGVLKEINAGGFFSSAARRFARQAENLRTMPPEIVERFIAKHTTASPTRSPIMPPPAG